MPDQAFASPVEVVVLGSGGQLGQCLQAAQNNTCTVAYFDRLKVDITDFARITDMLMLLQPRVVINASGYTAVDKAETESELAYHINSKAVANLAQECVVRSITLIHVSTDFVFNGQSSKPWSTSDATDPLGVYGASKQAGELAIMSTVDINAYIVRTSWLYSEYGNNFVKTMLRLMAECDSLGVVSDQIGSPTDSLVLAKVLWDLAAASLKSDYTKIESVKPGIYHWSDAGAITWHEFAVEIQQQALKIGLITREIPISRIGTADYPTAARRPAFSVLDCNDLVTSLDKPQTDWRLNLGRVLKAIATDMS